MKSDYPDTLALCIMESCIGVKQYRKPHFYVEAEEWCAWAVKFMNAKMRRIAKLVRIIGNNYLEEIFGSQATLYILRPLKYQQLFLDRLKKPGGKDWQQPNNGNMKYGIGVPRNVKEAV